MKIYFTICSNNYLAQAQVLGNSLAAIDETSSFIIGLVDEKSREIDYDKIPFEVLPVHLIEPKFHELWKKYNIVELNTCIKPRIVEYLFTERDASIVVYMDPDTRAYDNLNALDELLSINNILLTPHIFTPIPIDGKSPQESVFLNFGLYNLGFIALKKSEESMRFTQWWKERTYKAGYFRICEGLFVDQLPINLVPLLFKGVHILDDKGYNMAPWNLHERYLSVENGNFIVNKTSTLKFFHFSSFKINTGELPVHYYNRFSMKDRPDLIQLFSGYNKELSDAGYSFYSPITCVYMLRKEEEARELALKNWKRNSPIKRLRIKIRHKIRQTFKSILNIE